MARNESPAATRVKKSRDKVEAFKRLATKRVNKALRALVSIGDLSNKASYTYDDAQVSKILLALQQAGSTVQKRFEAAKSGTISQGFEL